jgi:phosphatidylglycerophosphatase A
MTRLALIVATAGGAGYAPVAPGTFGSAVGLAIYFLTWRWSPVWQLALLGVVTLIGIWAADVAARHFNREDPGQVVIDEVAGQLVTLYLTGAGIWGAILGFFVFRALDIVKPWPARQLERLHGGVGIIADDLMAGVYGHLLLRLAGHLLPVFFF